MSNPGNEKALTKNLSPFNALFKYGDMGNKQYREDGLFSKPIKQLTAFLLMYL